MHMNTFPAWTVAGGLNQGQALEGRVIGWMFWSVRDFGLYASLTCFESWKQSLIGSKSIPPSSLTLPELPHSPSSTPHLEVSFTPLSHVLLRPQNISLLSLCRVDSKYTVKLIFFCFLNASFSFNDVIKREGKDFYTKMIVKTKFQGQQVIIDGPIFRRTIFIQESVLSMEWAKTVRD